MRTSIKQLILPLSVKLTINTIKQRSIMYSSIQYKYVNNS